MHFNMISKVLSGVVVSKFGIKSQAVTSMWAQHPEMTMLRACPNITLAAEWDVNPNFYL